MGRKEKTWRYFSLSGELDYTLTYENNFLIKINGINVDFDKNIEF